MQMRQRDTGRTAQWGVAICIAAVCVAVALVIALAEHGTFTRMPPRGAIVTLPGITLDDDGANTAAQPTPIVTSLRSDSEAQRLGIRVGDHITAVDGRPVHNVAALREAVFADHGRGPVALHILRGTAVWTIAIDRAEPAPDRGAGANGGHGVQDPAD